MRQVHFAQRRNKHTASAISTIEIAAPLVHFLLSLTLSVCVCVRVGLKHVHNYVDTVGGLSLVLLAVFIYTVN